MDDLVEVAALHGEVVDGPAHVDEVEERRDHRALAGEHLVGVLGRDDGEQQCELVVDAVVAVEVDVGPRKYGA
ncbi:hypothetical protein [Streptosporangium vulgare]|uniref:Uncharacterized protein n=1 Tax=Streptosporangium vulgare TaxID=46190 RepID=A0ABV5TFW8_9ACTN